MNVRISATLAMIIGLAVPMFQSSAIAEPTASSAMVIGKTTGSLSAVAKANLISKLKAAKLREKQERKSGPQNSARIAEYDKRIYTINVLITKIGDNEDVALSEVDQALSLAHTP
ncbi:MAG: hypothetical protein Q7S58_15545 [Candidatus Binatus sp.]|uniref:hypothetical protein n=1 Tax=Candidatus Binatus sp. TaxID=2811406 RepID=UPI00271EFA12|nr:hypothetical protein [Candidatus Binatus sp.]MDO8433815.1 hypothetical protein [Candidatus Binatus sp.]